MAKSTKKPGRSKGSPTQTQPPDASATALIQLSEKLGAALAAAKAKPDDLKLTVELGKLAAGQRPTHAGLVALRDGIKTAARAARAAKLTKPAEQLAHLNRAVRRLERAARKGGHA